MVTILIKNIKSSGLTNILFHNTKIDSNKNTDIITYKDAQYKVTWDVGGDELKYDYCFYYHDVFYGNPNYKEHTHTNILTFHGEKYNTIGLFRNDKTRKISNKLGSGYVSDDIRNKFLLSQTLFAWNEYADIRIWKEYENVHHKINHNYKLGLFFSRINDYRSSLVNKLKDNTDIFINQFSLFNDSKKIDGVTQHNIRKGINDFDNIKLLTDSSFPLDFFFRVLPNTKAVLNIETLETKSNYNFLTEKTYGLILGGIPFIPIHTFILDMIQSIGFNTLHPFDTEIREFDNSIKKTSEFIKTYLEDEPNNYYKLVIWVNQLKAYMLSRLYSENSLLDNLRFFKKETSSLL